MLACFAHYLTISSKPKTLPLSKKMKKFVKKNITNQTAYSAATKQERAKIEKNFSESEKIRENISGYFLV
jgi:hypothetical protein